jgi:FkbM family methyltransferase
MSGQMLQFIDRCFLKQPLFRRFITRVLAGTRVEKVVLLGREIQVHTAREHGYYRASKLSRTCSLFRDELPVLLHLAGLLRDGDTFLDVGANIGVFCVNIASFRTLYPNLQVYAFEPNPDTAARLRVNAEPLGITVFPFALADHNGSLEFVNGAVSNVFTTTQNASSYSIRGERSLCECRRLEDLPVTGDSIVMKVDVEGQELEVLLGAKRYFDCGRIRALYLGRRNVRDVPGAYPRRGRNGLAILRLE